MGLEVTVNSMEEMCDLMCDNVVPKPKKEYWIFTFGCGHKYGGKYVRIAGDYNEARNKMVQKYGTEWAFQYSEEEWEKYRIQGYAVETEMEVIE